MHGRRTHMSGFLHKSKLFLYLIEPLRPCVRQCRLVQLPLVHVGRRKNVLAARTSPSRTLVTLQT